MVETEQTQQEKRYWQKPENWIATGTFILVLIYTGVQIVQTWIISSNNVVSQRAFINFTFGQPLIAGDPTDPKAVNFFANLNNSGNTPTKNLSFFYKCAPSAEDLRDPWSILYQGKENPEKLPQFIGGHASIPIGCSFTWQQIEQMAAGKLFGYLMLEATYWDRLDDKTKHTTQIAMMLTQVFAQAAKNVSVPINAANPISGPVQINVSPLNFATLLINRGKHNCADEECPSQ